MQTTWQPIATAPKGTEHASECILVWSPSVGVVIAAWSKFQGRRMENGEFEGGWSIVHDFGDGYGTPSIDDATHWMPLPDPPED